MQDLFLAAAARDHERMTVFLVNGVMLQGSVAAFDQFSLLLERGGQVQLVYKHAISTLQPEHALESRTRAGGRRSKEEAAPEQFRRQWRDRGRARRTCPDRRAASCRGEASRRSAEARIEEAQGLAEAIGVVVAAERTFRLRVGQARDPARQGPGRGGGGAGERA